MRTALKNSSFDRNINPCLVIDLSFAGQMSIWGIRLLGAGHRADIDISKSLIEGFRKCNASRAGSNLLFLMDIVFGGLIREVEINCGCNPSLNKDEINFLELFSISQNQGDIESKIRSLDFLNDIAVRNAAPLFTDYAISLRDAGLILTFGKKGSLMRKLAAHSMEVSTKMH